VCGSGEGKLEGKLEVRPGMAAVGIAGGHEALSSRISDRIQYIHPQDVMFNSAHPTRSRAEFNPWWRSCFQTPPVHVLPQGKDETSTTTTTSH
jgi:hypothetical protein